MTGRERGDLEIKDYVVLQKPQPQANRLPPPRTLIVDYTMTHIRFGCSHVHPMVQLTNIRRSDGAPDPDGPLKDVVRIKIRHYRNLYLNHPDPMVFIPLGVDTTVRLYESFIRLLFLHAHREASALTNELPEESDQFRFLRAFLFRSIEGCCRFDNGEIIDYSDFNTLGPFLSSFHSTSVFYSFVSPYTSFNSFPCTFSSLFCLSGTC